jgi:flagellar biogenesis protein FliO
VQVGNRTLLVGATDQTVTLLTEITEPAPSPIVVATQPAPPAFSQALNQALNQPDFTPLPSGGNSPA